VTGRVRGSAGGRVVLQVALPGVIVAAGEGKAPGAIRSVQGRASQGEVAATGQV
jgi:hypothetical protein